MPGHDDLAAAAWEKFQKDAKPIKTKTCKEIGLEGCLCNFAVVYR